MSSNHTIPVGFAFDFANLSSNCGYRFICFRQRILQGTNALCFQLLTLIAAYWLQIGPIVPTSHPIYNPAPIFKIILQKIQHKMSFQKGLQIIGLPSDPIVWSYQVISPQQNSYCLWLWWSRQKNYISKTVQPLMVCLSLGGADFKSIISRTLYPSSFDSIENTWLMLMSGSWTIRAGHVWYRWFVRGWGVGRGGPAHPCNLKWPPSPGSLKVKVNRGI